MLGVRSFISWQRRVTRHRFSRAYFLTPKADELKPVQNAKGRQIPEHKTSQVLDRITKETNKICPRLYSQGISVDNGNGVSNFGNYFCKSICCRLKPSCQNAVSRKRTGVVSCNITFAPHALCTVLHEAFFFRFFQGNTIIRFMFFFSF